MLLAGISDVGGPWWFLQQAGTPSQTPAMSEDALQRAVSQHAASSCPSMPKASQDPLVPEIAQAGNMRLCRFSYHRV